jgi:hypothetical protein
MYGTERPNVFRKMRPKESWPDEEDEGIEEKIRKAYVKMKKKEQWQGKNVASGEMQIGIRN